MAEKVIIAYIPALHQGYKRFFDNYAECTKLFIVDQDITGNYRHLQKEIRALKPMDSLKAIEGWNRFSMISLAQAKTLRSLGGQDIEIIMPDDELSHDIARTYFPNKNIEFYPVFLRWDRRRSSETQEVSAPTVAVDEMAKQMLGLAYAEAGKSTNIWRRVGAVLAKNGTVIAYSSNRQRPSEYGSWIDGDVRANFGKGVGIEMSTDQHAESCVIAEAAKQGVALEGADLYVTTFPCPPCSMLIAYSGIARLYYAEGYAVLDGQRILEAQGVELHRVTVAPQAEDERAYIPYPES